MLLKIPDLKNEGIIFMLGWIMGTVAASMVRNYLSNHQCRVGSSLTMGARTVPKFHQ